MVPVLVLCIAIFVVNVACHLLAIEGSLEFSGWPWGLQGLVVVGAAAAMLTHPKSSIRYVSPPSEDLPGPYWVTAFLLFFSTVGLVVAHSSVLYHRRPFGFDEPE